MPGKLEYWSREEIGTVIVFLDAVNFPHEEICRRISEVCGMDAVSRKEVDHILAVSKYAEVPTAAGIAPFDENLFSVLPTEEDIEISDLLELFSESILNYPVQSSKYQWNSVSQFHPLHFGKATDVQNCDGVGDQVLHDKLHNILESFSPQNFSVSVSEVKQLGITTEGNLNEVIDAVFEKAIDKPAFSIPYANMCKLLTLLKVPCSGQQTHFVDIRELLLTKCQKEFERNEVNQLCREEISMPVQMCEADVGNEDFAMIFAAKVSQAIAEDNQSKVAANDSSELISDNSCDLAPPEDEIKIPEFREQYNEQETVICTENATVPYCNRDSVDMNSISETVSIEKVNSIVSNEPVVEIPKTVEYHNLNDTGKSEEYSVPPSTIEISCRSESSGVADETEKDLHAAAVDEIFNSGENKGSEETEDLPRPSQADDENVPSSNSDDSIFKQPAQMVKSQQTLPKVKSQQNGDILKTSNCVTVSKEEKPVGEVNKKRKNKKEDLNKRGESKEVGDMDAFLDKTEDVSSVTQNPQLQQAMSQQPVAPTAATVITRADSPLAVSVQDDTPDAENEKNQRNDNSVISDNLQDSPVLSGEETDVKDTKESPVEEAPKNQITLKYSYKEDQWSPLNPEGKKQYDREFLLNLQSQPMSMKKPSNLPNLDVIKDKATLHKHNELNNRLASAAPYPSRGGGYADPFEPAFARTNAPGCGPMHSRGVKGRGSICHENEPPRNVINLNTLSNLQIKLQTAENVWALSRKNETEVEDARTQNNWVTRREREAHEQHEELPMLQKMKFFKWMPDDRDNRKSREEYLRQPPFVPGYSYAAATLQSVGGNCTHDMNKQVQPAPAGLYSSSPSGPMTGAGPQHHQPGLGGPVPTPQSTSVVPTQAQQLNARPHMAPMPNYSRQNASRQVPNMSRSSITTVVSQSAPPTLQQYGTVPLYSQQAAYTMSPQATMLMPPHVINYHQRSNFAAPHQFSMPSSQAPVYHLPSNNWNSYNQRAGVFFGQMSHMPSTCPKIPTQIQVQAGLKKTGSFKGLPITDPATGRDLREDIINEPSSQGAKDGNQADVGNEDFAMIFAAKVSQAIAEDNQSKVAANDSSELISDNSCDLAPPEDEIKIPEFPEQYNEQETVICTENATVPYCNRDSVDMNSISETVSIEKVNSIVSNEPVIVEIPKTVEYHNLNDTGKSEEYSVPPSTIEISCRSESSGVADETEKDLHAAAVDEIFNSEENKGSEETEDLPRPSQADDENIPSSNSDDSIFKQPAQMVKSQQTLPKVKSQQNGDIHKTSNCVTVSKEEKPVGEVNKKRKNKKEDLNKRGESKEVGDMDAFLDKTEDVSSVTQNPQLQQAMSQQPVAPTAATVITRADSPLAGSVQDDTPVAENEKNQQNDNSVISDNLQDSPVLSGEETDVKDTKDSSVEEAPKNEITLKYSNKEGAEEYLRQRPFVPVDQEQLQTIFEEELKSRRQRQLGTARFVAWLFKLDIFTESMMHQCIKNLLLQDGEVAVECVCILIIAVGNELCSDKIESYISDLKRKIDKQYASAKLGTILQHIDDLKVNKWMSYSEENSTKIIDEILLEGCREMLTHKKMSLPMDFDNSLSDDHEQQEINKKRKNKKKDLNKRGESKECDDMDAFLDKTEDVSSVTQNPQLQQAMSQQPVAPTAATVITCADSPLAVSVQDDMPDGENEKNQQNDNSVISDHLQDSPVLSGEETDVKDTKESPVEEAPKNQITLKYSYKEDQWSPLNPKGKKQYDREFLLNLQSQPMSMKKPSNLPKLDVIKDKATLHKLNELNNRMASAAPYPSRGGGYTDPFEPAFARTNAPGRGPMHAGGVKGRGSIGHEKKPPRNVINRNTPANQQIKLHTAKNVWALSRKNETEVEDARTQTLHKKVRGILNKLTPQKLTTLVTQFKQLITTEESLNGLIDLVFEKAIDERNFSVPYASMCKHLALIKVPSGVEGTFVNFRKLLLTKCQREFEKDRTDEQNREERIRLIQESETDEKRKQLQEDFEEEERKNRRRQLGNIRFIGELFKLGMLTESIMHQCIGKLLIRGDEDSLECLCRLLTTIGKELENEKKTNTALMEKYFTVMKKIVDKKQTTSRVRSMLQDVIDLRVNNWVTRHDENNPKTIGQIHKEAERELQQMLQEMTFPKRMPDDRDPRKSRPPISEDGWNMSGKSSKGNYSVDPMKLKLTKLAEAAESMQLDPRGKFSSWAEGSSGGTKLSSIEQDSRPATSQNNRSAASSRESSRGRNNQLPPPTARKTPSVSRECDNVIEAVKTFTRTRPPEQRPSETRPQEAQNVNGKDVAVLKGAELSVKDIEKKTKPLIDEFLHNSDLEEAVRCVLELASPSTVCVFITSAVNQVLEYSSQSRHMLGNLLHTLLKRKIIPMEQYNKGLKDVLEYVDEYVLDIPLIWDYLGELIEPILDDDYVSLAFLKDTLQPCIPSQTAGKLVSAVLLCASKKRGTLRVGEMWKESKLSWTDFLNSTTDVDGFVKSHKLEFTTKQTAEPKLRKQITPEDVKQNLQRLLHDHESNEEIFNWLERHIEGEMSPPMYRALVTVIYESVITGSGTNCELNNSKLKERMRILARYMDVNRNLELHAIFALQYLMNKLHHPKGILLQIFDLAYNEDFLSDDAFKQWAHCDDPAEQEGRGVAIHSVSSFFTWLKEAEDDESAEGD